MSGRRGAITGLSKDVIIEITGGGILLKSTFQKLMK
ncbi:hypothetical protein X926_09600 [Petrotoga sp. HWHPT.55.6.3]|nr:hypothetical protein X926_09600 [Petrotoga sp. HWHPT.55.6.3]